MGENLDDRQNDRSLVIKFVIIYLFLSILGIIFIGNLANIYNECYSSTNLTPLTIILIVISYTGIILFLIILYFEKVIKSKDMSYSELKNKEEERLAPYEFALDNSVDAIYWFTLDAKFVYVNDAACQMLGCEKEDLLGKYLEVMDPNFDRQGAIDIMHEIFDSKYWSLETTQKRKDGTILNVEVTGHAFTHAGKDYVCAFGRDITQRFIYKNKITNMNQKLQKSLDEKEILLKEIHHRVKNNMEIISSLLAMQYRRIEDENLKSILKQSRSRINTMALVHEFLYLGDNLANINLEDYIKRLVDDIKELYISNNTYLDVDMKIDKLVFSTDRCIQVGMILHELCVNSLKYAFKENRKNLLCIHICKGVDDVHIKIRDNGDEILDIENLSCSNSIGMQLINSIVEDQLDGEIEFKNNKGLECNIFFPIKESE